MGIESTRDRCSLRGANGNNGANKRAETSTQLLFGIIARNFLFRIATRKEKERKSEERSQV